MTPPPPRMRRRTPGASPVRRARKLGEIRRAQLITTYGVGAMIAVDNESFIVSGLDSWDISQAPKVWERRLSRSLGVKYFRLPPAPDPDEAQDGVRAVRFPVFYSCPTCKSLQPFAGFNSPAGKAECSDCEEALVPSRFVVACDHGHLSDFPYWQWVHRGNEHAAGGRCGGELRLRAEGSTASLRAVLIGCTCGAKEVSMEGAFRRQALKKLGIRCSGKRPWLSGAPAEFCDRLPRTLQRGSSSVWFPIVHSALSIPPWSEALNKIVAPYYDRLKDETPEGIRAILRFEKLLDKYPQFSPAQFIDRIAELRRLEEAPQTEQVDPLDAREEIYQQEYTTLHHTHPEQDGEHLQDFVCEPPSEGIEPLKDSGLGNVMLVKRLREVRALHTFTRVDEPSPADDMLRRSPLSGRPLEWLPAIEVSGEGVFLRLDDERLRRWEQSEQLTLRAERIRDNHNALLRERAAQGATSIPTSPASPRFLLVHTLAHILINEWSLDGGYPAAALRERLYIGKDMAGLLIYTATSDSAGSLGGIVAQGDPERLREALASALARAAWCSNDPLCMESTASGTDNLNLAACHACVLLPETSCEMNNALLDRAVLIGTHGGTVPGYFSQQ
ncbi:DrmB family protein [Streptomyces sp. NPDC057072]|uniref:DrmB family protein n=1 Tax=Streptomyces sp. NPDC057072 TaxID=3346014 RepID=UPI00362881FD